MKYGKGEAREYAKEALRGIWTSLPYHFTPDDRLDEAAIRRNVDIVIDDLQVDGHYSDGNVAEFWSLPLEERKRAQEVMLEATAGRVPLMAGTRPLRALGRRALHPLPGRAAAALSGVCVAPVPVAGGAPRRSHHGAAHAAHPEPHQHRHRDDAEAPRQAHVDAEAAGLESLEEVADQAHHVIGDGRRR